MPAPADAGRGAAGEVGKIHKEALRAFKRRISDAINARLRTDALAGPGGQTGNASDSSAPGERGSGIMHSWVPFP
jgi:hypothetical protein